MPDLTPKLGIKKPLGNENVTRASFNENWDIIDANTVAQSEVGNGPNQIPRRDANGKLNADLLNGKSVLELANVKRGSGTFNGTTGMTIAHTKGDTNYSVSIVPTANPNGFLGEIWVEKSANSFKVFNSGSSKVAFDYVMVW